MAHPDRLAEAMNSELLERASVQVRFELPERNRAAGSGRVLQIEVTACGADPKRGFQRQTFCERIKQPCGKRVPCAISPGDLLRPDAACGRNAELPPARPRRRPFRPLRRAKWRRNACKTFAL